MIIATAVSSQTTPSGVEPSSTVTTQPLQAGPLTAQVSQSMSMIVGSFRWAIRVGVNSLTTCRTVDRGTDSALLAMLWSVEILAMLPAVNRALLASLAI